MAYSKNNVKFNLKNTSDKKEKSQIMLVHPIDGVRFRYYTGKRIEPIFWLLDKQRAKPSYASAITLNEYLNTLANFVEDTINNHRILGKKLFPDDLKNLLNERFNKESTYDIFSRFEEYIEVSNTKRAANTLKKYKTTLKQLKEYSEAKHVQIEYDAINLQFLDKLRKYLIDEYKLTNNSLAKYFKTFKSFLNWSHERGYTTNIEFQKFKVKQFDGEIYFLTWEELMKIFDLEINNPKLERVRDLFCFGCFTGLRFSDIINLKQENISRDTIQIETIKTKGKTTIPLNQYSRIIYEKYKSDETFSLFHSISNQKMNTYLKELGRLAGLNEPVQIVRYLGSKRIEKSVKKYEVLTSHVARKTFITNAMIRGMSTEVIMDITTHTSYKSFQRYFKIVDDHKRNQMDKVFG
ncbi:MAG: site-specific integrase [Prolixibacteraceae bacterium]|nr:site-specific integrase [Prolixibacteraceae bacterium]